MVNSNVVGGSDGVTFPGGWTDQANLTGSLESYANSSSYLFNPPSQNGFLAWSMVPQDSIASFTIGTTLTNYLTKIFVPASGTTTKGACIPHTNVANVSAFYMALYSADGQTKIAATAESHTPLIASGNDVLYEPSWAASASVVGGLFYYVVMIVGWATGAPTFAGCAGSSAASLNAGLTAATSFAASNGTAATPPASYTMASNTALASAPWVAIL